MMGYVDIKRKPVRLTVTDVSTLASLLNLLIRYGYVRNSRAYACPDPSSSSCTPAWTLIQ
jgi:hypothetical protein